MHAKFSAYALPSALVDCAWVQAHLEDPKVRIVESNEDILLYDAGHIPAAVHISWAEDLQNKILRDTVSPEEFAQICSRAGISPDTTVVFCGDRWNWWAAFALWVFRLFGHADVRLLDGGREKWKAEGRPMSREKVRYPSTQYPVPAKRKDAEIRAFYAETLSAARAGGLLIDTRSPGEYRGDITHMADYPQEGVLRGGHIPGARSVHWKSTVREDGTFKTFAELQQLYRAAGLQSPSDEVITYCRIGERSSHSWFVLTYLLGCTNVRNYDGSWTEWGNTVRAPVVKGDEPGKFE